MNFAIVENNEVVNVVVCNSLEDAKSFFGENVIDVTNENVSVGDIWNDSHNKFIRPAGVDYLVLDENGNWHVPGKPSPDHIYNPETSSWELPE